MSWLPRFLTRKPDGEANKPEPQPASEASAQPPAAEASAPPPSVSPESEEWQEGQIVFDEFEIVRLLGRGELGPIYVAFSTSIGRRYAVRRVKFENADRQADFLSELHPWLYLPENPHLVACRFTRTKGTEVVVFVDVVEGQALKDLIKTRKLYDEDPNKTLERLLDIAIQLAWGIDAVHQMKVVHQNIKPGNIFVTTTGVVKISEIGLGEAATFGRPVGVQGDSQLSAGLVNYSPPEQAARKAPSPALDIWCWGASVLEMLVPGLKLEPGPPPKLSNREILERLQYRPSVVPPSPVLPKSFAAILYESFQPDPSQRWGSMADVANAMRELYAQIVKKPYPRQTPARLHRGTLLAIAHARWMPGGGAQWDSPEEWLGRVSETPKHPESSRMRGSRKRQAQADMPGYIEAQRVYEDLLAKGRKEIRHSYAILCFEKAFLHVSLDELPQALGHFDKTIKILNELITKDGRGDLANDLAMAYLNRAIALKNTGGLKDAAEVFKEADKIYQRLVEKEGRQELAANWGWEKALHGEALFQWSNEALQRATTLTKTAEDARALAASYLTSSRDTANLDDSQTYIKKSQEQEDIAKQATAEAAAKNQMFRDRQRDAQEEAREALRLLKREVMRTARDELKAILNWAEETFESLV